MKPEAAASVTAHIQLAVAGHQLQLELTLPTASVRPRELLPLYRGLAENLVQIGVANEQAAGRTVSCRKGCGACCRQLVPISELEAWRIRELLDELPAERRAALLERFDAARARLEDAGLLEELRGTSLDNPVEFGLRYFALAIACPFLEDEACSIYEDRPIACREYLVTTPPAHCARPTRESVATVPLPGRVSRAVRALTAPAGVETTGWVPLVLAPQWADAHPEPAASRTGPELVKQLFRDLASGEVPAFP